MPEVLVGARSIEYCIRRSPRAVRKRIEVGPGGVEVVVPEDASEDDVERFVHGKRRWLHNKTEEIRERVERLRGGTPEGFHSGAKILVRGRYLRLRVREAEVERPELTYRTAFNVDLPRGLPESRREAVVRGLVERWLEERLLEDGWAVARHRGTPHGLKPRGIRIKDQRTLWGSCGRDGVLRLDRKLARVPKGVLEYVVVHELCHLAHRDHSAAFWRLVSRVLPDYRQRKEWLEAHEVRVG